MAKQFQHSVEVGVSREAAWRFWTNVGNWTLDVAIEWVKLDGFFQAGAHGTTKTRGADPKRSAMWLILGKGTRC